MGKKNLFEFYGLSRLVIGVCQLVGLSAGFFLKEWVISYPLGSAAIIFDQELMALIYLAVFFRAIFNVIVGIGVARMREWVRFVIYGGWPISLLITFGLSSSLSVGWRDAGVLVEFSSVIHWGKVFALVLLVIFDMFVVVPFMRKSLQLARDAGQKVEYLSAKNMMIVILIIIFCLSVILFMGRSVKKGFHQGFYKARPASQSRITPAIKKASKARSENVSTSQESVINKQQKPEGKALSAVAEVGNQGRSASVKSVDAKMIMQKKEVGQWPVRVILAVFGVGCLIFGFLFQILETIKIKSAQNISYIGYACLVFGFFCFCVYGVSTKQLALTLGGFILFFECICVLWLKGEYE